jgi:hypothetical protein
MSRTFADRLLDLCESHAEEIAKRWYKDVSTSPRTPSYHLLSEQECLRRTVDLYGSLKQMYFAKDPYEEVLQSIDRKRYIEFLTNANIPLHEAVYAIIMMRRHIWLYADLQALFGVTAIDLYQAIQSINRTLLIFDYIIFIVTEQYQETI